MATTALSVLTEAAYRLGEDSNPDNAAEGNRRLFYLNTAIRHIIRKRYWWFTQKEYAFRSVSGQDVYSLPSDYRDMIDFRCDGEKIYYRSDYSALDTWDRPRDSLMTISADKQYYISNNEIHLIPNPSSAPSAVSVSSITVSSTTATVTTTTAHGYEVGDWMTIAGASVSALNASYKILTVPSTTTYTITVASGTTDPSGTMTATQDDLVMVYYYYPDAITSTSENVVIPDTFVDALSAYVFARVAQVDSERGDASDGFDEYNEILDQMIVENEKRGSWGKGVSSFDLL